MAGRPRIPIGRVFGFISETSQPILSPVLNYAAPEPALPPWSPLLASEKASWGQFHNARVFGLRAQHVTPRVPRSGLTLSQAGAPVVRKRNHGCLWTPAPPGPTAGSAEGELGPEPRDLVS